MKYFTKVFKDALQANANVLDNATLRLVLFRSAPGGDSGHDYTNIPTVKKLIDGNYPGWESAIGGGYPFASSVVVNPITSGTTEYTVFSQFRLAELTGKIEAMALGIEMVGSFWGEVNPLIFVTTEPFPKGRVLLTPQDVVTAYEDPKVGNQRWLMAWDLNADGNIRVGSLTMGDIAVSIGPPDYQSSHHLNAWLYPQRVNYIANPSFEAINNKYWGTSGTFTRVPSDMGGFAGRFVGGDLVLESNVFPTDQHDGTWTIQFLAKGTGVMTVGFVFWSERYDTTYVDWGSERWTLQPNSFLAVKTMRRCSEAVEGMLRIQIVGQAEIILDRVLVEPGPLIDWPYFDGDEQYGAEDDFSWYGTRGESYSLWYNNRRSIVSRIFTKPVYSGAVYTEQDEHGLAYDWVPAGTVVDYHLDVLRPNDLKAPPIVKTGVMPDTVSDPVFGVPGGTANVITADGATLVATAQAVEEVYIAGTGGT